MATTKKGEQTRARLIRAAADLVLERGVAGTSLDDVQAATSTSRSQLYHYFSGRADLLRAVVTEQTDRVIDAQQPALDHLDTWQALQRWCDFQVTVQIQRDCRGGCAIGSLVTELAETDEVARVNLDAAFQRWQSYLVRGLTAMRARGDLRPEADPETLATATMASLQGGLLLCQAARDPRPLRIALDAAMRHLRTWAPVP